MCNNPISGLYGCNVEAIQEVLKRLTARKVVKMNLELKGVLKFIVIYNNRTRNELAEIQPIFCSEYVAYQTSHLK